ncbi:AcrR family transcriptional regulator [Kitasatospora gansuensis]|uniref:AcrR family transcriptional regulator n=1 Tax=Kitasatospora gansuensis TaxID=258050 RepID=A0A7W7S9J3_9ACTN|nr:TetR family transcriptional regulator [Kitasatospora gansuensis]MBB4946385.1 AcrR family transcriptional regulator [Kitasatospora gansuensis]
MTDPTPDTRARILRTALAEFSARGYHATSVREIAELVGVTKAAVLYHFPAKADLLAALAEPMLDSLEATLAAAELRADSEEARWAAVEGMLQVWLTHRYLLRINLHDLALAAPGPGFDRFTAAMLKAGALVAGPAPDFAGQVRAAQAIAMLADPVVLFAEAPTAELQAAVLDGVRRLLGPAERPPTARRGRGRPSAVGPEMAATARRLFEAGRTAEEVAAELGVSRATVYRRFGGTGQ